MEKIRGFVLVVIWIAVLAIVEAFAIVNNKERIDGLSFQVDSLKQVCSSMEKTDTIVLNLSYLNSEEIKKLSNGQAVIVCRVNKIEDKVNTIDNELEECD